MKYLLEIIRYLLAGLLALVILSVYISNIALSTVLSEGYVLSKLSDTNYYKKIYEDCNENFKKYIMQSGLDESIIDGICSINKIEEDTIIILDNIYNGKNNNIDTESIKEKLNNNISLLINVEELTEESKRSIEEFNQLICDEYVNTLFHTKYENKVYDYIIKISKVLNIINKYGRWIALAIIFMILTINKKNPSRSISILGMSFLLIGLVIFYGKYILLKNMQIDNIFFLSTGFSDMIKNVLNENLNKIQKLAKVLSVLGVFFIVFGNAFQKKNSKIKKNKMLYLPGY